MAPLPATATQSAMATRTAQARSPRIESRPAVTPASSRRRPRGAGSPRRVAMRDRPSRASTDSGGAGVASPESPSTASLDRSVDRATRQAVSTQHATKSPMTRITAYAPTGRPVSSRTGSQLDLQHPTDPDIGHPLHHEASPDHGDPRRRAIDGFELRTRGRREHEKEQERKRPEDATRDPSLRRERPELTPDRDPMAHRRGDVVEGSRQVPPAPGVDREHEGEEAGIVGPDPRGERL